MLDAIESRHPCDPAALPPEPTRIDIPELGAQVYIAMVYNVVDDIDLDGREFLRLALLADCRVKFDGIPGLFPVAMDTPHTMRTTALAAVVAAVENQLALTTSWAPRYDFFTKIAEVGRGLQVGLRHSPIPVTD